MDTIKKFSVAYIQCFIVIFLADLLIDRTFNIIGNLKGAFFISAIVMLFGYIFKKLSYN